MSKITEKMYKLRKENINLWIFVIAIITIVPGLFFWWLHTRLIEPIDIVFRGLAETLLVAGFIGIFYERFIRDKFKEEMIDTILMTFEADAGFLKKKNLMMKRLILSLKIVLRQS